MIAKIHIAKADLGLDDDAYRDLLRRHGAESSARMTDQQLDSVLRELVTKGWKPKQPKNVGRTPKPSHDRAAQIAKIKALLTDKAKRQGRPVPWTYADAIAKRVCKVDRVEWVDTLELYKVISALEYDQKRGRR